jgi:hypothetical protein
MFLMRVPTSFNEERTVFSTNSAEKTVPLGKNAIGPSPNTISKNSIEKGSNLKTETLRREQGK